MRLDMMGALLGEGAGEMTGEDFAADLKTAFAKKLPRGTFASRVERGLGGRSGKSVFIQFTTTGKKDWSNGIIHNDPSMTQLWIHDGTDADGVMLPKVKIEMTMGGSVYGPNASNRQKVGWRDRTGTPAQLLKHVTAYFDKLRDTYDKFDNLPKQEGVEFSGESVDLMDEAVMVGGVSVERGPTSANVLSDIGKVAADANKLLKEKGLGKVDEVVVGLLSLFPQVKVSVDIWYDGPTDKEETADIVGTALHGKVGAQWNLKDISRTNLLSRWIIEKK